MKSKFLILFVVSILYAASNLHAGFHVSFGNSRHHHPYHSYHPCYPRHSYFGPHPMFYEPQPVVIVREAPAPTVVHVEEPSTTTTGENPPYGFMIDGGKIKSPWSDFTMSIGGKTSGELVYDPNTGQSFRIP